MELGRDELPNAELRQLKLKYDRMKKRYRAAERARAQLVSELESTTRVPKVEKKDVQLEAPVFRCEDKMSHTILLVQPTPKPESRTWSDYESTTECMEGICKIFEEHLKKQNPQAPSITYDVSQLFDFIDRLSDLSCLVFSKNTSTYVPHNKDWIKEQIYILLRRQAGK